MTDDNTNSNSPEDKITAIDFIPADQAKQQGINFIKPLLKGLLLLALVASGLALFFVLTAKPVIIDVTPDTAQVEVNGGFNIHLADHRLMRPGSYQLNASATGYQTATHPFTVEQSATQKQRVTLVLEKNPGNLVLNSSPAGADVSVDGKTVGKTPITIKDLKAGKHQITLNKTRYFPLEQTVDIEGMDHTQSMDLTLKPGWGNVQLRSSPSGAEVFVGGQSRGKTPLTTELTATELQASGEEVKLVLNNHNPWRKKIKVNAGKTHEEPLITLSPADGTLTITSTPKGASVMVNGKFKGQTPIDLPLTPKHTHTLTLFHKGYFTTKKTATLAVGETKKTHVNLKASLGKVTIHATPRDATIWINGKNYGRQGKTLQLPSSSQRIELRRQGYATKVTTITPKPGINQEVNLNLLTTAQAASKSGESNTGKKAVLKSRITTKAGQSLLLFQPQGSFTIGSSRRERGRRANEVQRSVSFSRPFYLAQKEVTNQQYKLFDRRHSSSHVSGNTLDRPSQPVVRVTWDRAAAYCNWLSQQEKLPLFYRMQGNKVIGINTQSTGYRLPTEAEWEWAARSRVGKLAMFAWDADYPPKGNPKTVGNVADQTASTLVAGALPNYKDGFVTSAPVGSFPANAQSLFDLEGNVSEWVNDFYGIAYTPNMPTENNSLGPKNGEFRVIKGPSWRHNNITELRLSFRDYGNQKRDDVGFRVARYAK